MKKNNNIMFNIKLDGHKFVMQSDNDYDNKNSNS